MYKELFNLKEKIVVITGGANGIGFACSTAFLEFGSKEQCVSYVQDNKDVLFYKSYEKYNKTIIPKMINCVDKDIMQTLSNIIKGKENEMDI